MAEKGNKVFVALSGGVDSSTATALLLREGFECSGVFMITCDEAMHSQAETQRIAEKLGIRLYILDLRTEFGQILSYFENEYKQGRTPNPCVICNKLIKFGKLWDFAKTKGANYYATGHYAQVLKINSHYGLYESTNLKKDQSYVLAMVEKDVLNYLILPMGNRDKSQTRKMAEKFGLEIKAKKESQEICFIPNDDYIAILEKRCPELTRKGKIIDSSSKVLGEHKGIHRFTIGQRRGLGVAMGRPYYVTKIDSKSNTVILGPKEEVMHSSLLATKINWLIDNPQKPFHAKVKIRYNSPGFDAKVYPETDSATVEFKKPVSAITPGQLAVFYIADGQGNRVAGGGWIESIGD